MDVGWPDSDEALIVLQHDLARTADEALRDDPFTPSRMTTVGGCFVAFARGEAGPGHPGPLPGWLADRRAVPLALIVRARPRPRTLSIDRTRKDLVANIKSQIKRNKQNEKRRVRNKAVRSELKTRSKNAVAAVEAGEDATEATRLAVKRIDKAAAKGVIHKNKASRDKSRLVKQLAKIEAGAEA